MCLMLGGGSFNDALKPQFPPTAAAEEQKKKLQIVGIIQLCLAIALLILSGAQMGMMQLITVMCLFCATMNYNYCCLLFYIVYTGFDFLQNLDPLGLYVQNGFPSQLISTTLVILTITVIFEPIAIWFAFQAYKEFKGCMIDNMTGAIGGSASYNPVSNPGNSNRTSSYNGNGTAYGGQNSTEMSSTSSRSSFSAFKGKGVRLG